MKQRPILFSAPMIRALLNGSKTQTRRIIKPQPPCECSYVINGGQNSALCFHQASGLGAAAVWVTPTAKSKDHRLTCPQGKPGDQLWVRESFQVFSEAATPTGVELSGQYTADGTAFSRELNADEADKYLAWKQPTGGKPGIFMFQSLSRLTLEIVSIRAQRLQDISKAEAIAEGLEVKDSERWPGRKVYRDYLSNDQDTFEDGEWFINPIDSYRTLWQSINGIDSWDANPWVWVIEFKKL